MSTAQKVQQILVSLGLEAKVKISVLETLTLLLPSAVHEATEGQYTTE